MSCRDAVHRSFPQAPGMIKNGAVQVEPLISHRLSLANFRVGIEQKKKKSPSLKGISVVYALV